MTVRLTVVTLELLFKRLTVVLLCINQHSDMKYAYENLGDDQFEKLIVFLCMSFWEFRFKASQKGSTEVSAETFREKSHCRLRTCLVSMGSTWFPAVASRS